MIITFAIMSYLFSSESVSEGHPDKIADQISDAIVDNYLAFDANSKVIGAISVSGPSVRIEEQKLPNFGRVTLRTAKELTRALGGIWPS